MAWIVTIAAILFFTAISLPAKKVFARRRILVVGDSLVDGYSRYVKVKDAAIKPLYRSGRGVAILGGLLPTAIREFKPTDVIIGPLGVNDIVNGHSADYILDSYKMMADVVKKSGANLYIVELTPWAGHLKYNAAVTKQVNKGLWELAKTNRTLTIATSILADNNDRIKNEYSAKDGLHLNQNGYKLLGMIVSATLEKI